MSYDYICLECGEPFSQYSIHEYTEDYGEHFSVSPCCNSAIDIASQCIDCEEYFGEEEMFNGRCKVCDKKHDNELIQCDICEQWVDCDEIENGICNKCENKVIQFKKHIPNFMQIAH